MYSDFTLDQEIRASIERIGYFLTGVFPVPQTNGYSLYSIGLSETYNHPELLVFALPPHAAKFVLDDLIRGIDSGKRVEDGALFTAIPEQPMAARAITAERAAPFTRQLRRFYSDRPAPPEVIQIVMSDQNGILPWEPGFNEIIRRIQPELWSRLH